MINVSNISVSFEGRSILEGVSFSINPGNKVGLVGVNGSGKTTLLRILTGELAADSGNISISKKLYKISYVPQHLTLSPEQLDLTVLSFMLEGRDLVVIRKRMEELGALIDQENSQADMDSINEYIRLQEEFNQKEGYRSKDDIASILDGLGIGNVQLSEKIINMSGGQKTRLALARMLYEDSDLLLLDEPTNHIDEESVKWFTNYLARIRKPILVISHAPEFLDSIVNRILLLEDRHLKSYPGNFSKFIHLRQKEGIASSRATEKLLSEIERHRRFIKKAPQNKSKMKHSREKLVAKLEKQIIAPVRQLRKMKFQISPRKPLRSSALNIQAVSKSFGKRRILDEISFELGPTERIGILGENGAGKTTLLKIIYTEMKPDKGKVILNPKVEMGWYRQEQEGLNDAFSVLEEVKQANSDLSTQIVRGALSHFLFPSDRTNQRVGTLSRGERARLALCKIMLSGSNMLLLDEPTNHLDQASRDSLTQALLSYKGALIIVSHDQDFLRGIGVLWSLKLPLGEIVRID
ncbi:MAG TPA: hypothetical protein DIC35_03085 [Candidatus Moranbacteria bacterium]|nr:hypothetical protein [Candidatus Moranbacteria bacterium]